MENSMEDHCICSVLHNCSPLSRYLKTTLINGKYHFVRTLGKGACGEVILAHNVENREEVAIKIIDTMDIPPSILQMIHNEVDIMKKLDHPNVVKFYDSFHLEETFFIVMEYANGGNLLDFLIKNGPLTEDKARPIFQQVVSAIGHLHDMGIVHHDIKLENLLLDSGNNVKLADFGFSTFDKGQQLDLFCGTPLYMAPELYRGVPYNGEKIDIWALGITLNAILTNCFAFSEDGLNIIAANFTNIEYRPPTTLTSHCRRLLEAMLHYDPQRRWTAHKILKSKWLENPSLSKEPNSIIGSSYIDRNPTLISDPEEEPEITCNTSLMKVKQKKERTKWEESGAH